MSRARVKPRAFGGKDKDDGRTLAVRTDDLKRLSTSGPEPGGRPEEVFFDRTALWLFLAALVVRVLYTLLRDVGNPIPPGTDAISYDAFARAMLSGTDWITKPGPELFRPPGYPAVLAVLYVVTGHTLTLVQLFQSLIGALSVVLVYNMGRRHFSRTAGILAAVWLLVNPLHLDFNGKLLRETWLVCLNVALLMSLLARDGTKTRGVLRTALLFTVLIHFDSRYVFHLPFFALYYPAVAQDGGLFRRLTAALRPVVLFGVVVLALSLPWAIRNAVAYDHFVLIDPRALGRWGKRAQTAVTGEAPSEGSEIQQFETAKRSAFPALTAEERSAFDAGLRPRSGQAAKALFNFSEFWRIVHLEPEYRPFPDGRFASRWSLEHNVSSFLFMGLLLPAFLIGASRGLSAGHRATLLCVLFILVHTLLHVLVHSVVRYRLPVEPFYGLIAFEEMSRWFSRRPGRAPEPRASEPRLEVPA